MSLILHSMFNYSSSPAKLAKILWNNYLTCLSSSWKWSPPVASCHIWSHLIILTDLIKLYIRSPGHYCFHQRLNDTFVSARNNMAQMVKRLSAMQETQVRSLGLEDPLEKEMAAHSNSLAWKIP